MMGALFLCLTGFGSVPDRDPGNLSAVFDARALPIFDLAGVAGDDLGFANRDLDGQVALIHVFASWCGSCRAEQPMLMRLATVEGVAIYGVDWKDRPGAGAAYLAERGSPYRRVGDDRGGKLASDLGVTGVPETFVVDRQGLIRYRHVGPIDDGTWTEMLGPLLAVLAGS
jgi:cytochrome c biogenesis protein CcmG/thiol:disulfide interchange protein DsbE